MKISDLKPDMKRVDLTAKVIEVSEPREVVLRNGQTAHVADATLNDDTGTVKMALWNAQIEEVIAGTTVTVEKGYTTSFRGETQLNVGRYGKLSVTF